MPFCGRHCFTVSVAALLVCCFTLHIAAAQSLILTSFAQETSNGDFSSLSATSTTATVISTSNTTFSVTSSGYCSADARQSNIQYVSVDITPVLLKYNASNVSQAMVTFVCSRPEYPQCWFYKWAPRIGFVAAAVNATAHLVWPSPYTGACTSYSNAQACASETWLTNVTLPQGNMTSRSPCHAVTLPVTMADVAAYGGAAIVALKVPFTTAVCSNGGGFLSITCEVSVVAAS